MKYRLHGLTTRYDEIPDETLPSLIGDRLGIYQSDMLSYKIVRRSIDARKKPVQLVYTVDIETRAAIQLKDGFEPKPPQDLTVEQGKIPLPNRPVVIGAGPAGLFAGYLLAQYGLQPLILERGGTVAERNQAIEQFRQSRIPDPECNVLFGMGGAGTFSDGKLTTSLSHPWIGSVLQILVDCGAPENILIDAKPHIGTDILQAVVNNLSARISQMGGEIRTGVRFEHLVIRDGSVIGIQTNQGQMDTTCLILAIGHSARTTLNSLEKSGVSIQPKPFQLGIRVEHPQQWLDDLQYGSGAGHPALGAAEYKVTTRVGSTPVFSFCMCPGGETLATVNEPQHLCVNGMSYHSRNSQFSSSGIVVTILPEQINSTCLRDSLRFVRHIENTCYHRGGADYRAPAQRITSFIKGNKDKALPPNSYKFGLTKSNLHDVLPNLVTEPLRHAMTTFNRTLPGFVHPDGLAIAPEARASSPVRISRKPDTRESTTIAGLYPVGEGAGYAGGIMSSAVDGLNSARVIVERYRHK